MARGGERLEAEVRGLGLADKFVFTGLVPPSEIPRYLGIADFLVHLSLREGLARARCPRPWPPAGP